MSQDTEARWALIEQTRPHDANTHEPEPGSFGRAFLLWHNKMVDRVFVMRRAGKTGARIQRMIGGQHMDVQISSLRTEGEILSHLRAKHPGQLPKNLKNWTPARLPVAIVDEIWSN